VPPLSASETITITVREVSAAPVANATTVETEEDTPVAIGLSGSDPEKDVLSYAVVSGPGHGTLSGTAPNLTYQPATNYFGLDAFTFKVSDGKLESAVAEVAIVVRAVNDAPTVRLRVPVGGAQFVAPATIELEAEASDVDGRIAKVEFFDATTLLGESTASPFRLSWTNAVGGSHLVTARATDNAGGQGMSESVAVEVLASLRTAEVLEDGRFRFRLAGEPGRSYVIERSEDLIQWTPQQTNTLAADGWLEVVDSVPAGEGSRYYRARREP
jgi:hypothetical protein